MNESNCKTIRNQIEESALAGDYDQLVIAHLKQCAACSQFERERSRLRELVGSLGMVQAPADFDFKLRARMAQQSERRVPGWWSFSPVFAYAAAIVLFVGVIAGVSYVKRSPADTLTVHSTPQPPSPVETPSPEPLQNRGNESTARDIKQEVKHESPIADTQRERRQSVAVVNKPKRSIVAADFSSTGAESTRSANQVMSPNSFTIDASLNSMKVSVDDGRGNARTISVPGVSFGSQRVLTGGNQLVQKGVW